MNYDSKKDTLHHIERVNLLVHDICHELHSSARGHDASKLLPPEKEVFDEMTPKLAGSTYGSDEYKGFLVTMQTALAHHYANNRHHPEHYTNGVSGMSLIDLVEMFCDWKAATMRHANGDILKSIEHNAERFGLSEQVKQIFINTVTEMGW